MRYLAFILATLWLLAAPTPAAADQTDPRLDALFEELQNPDPPGSAPFIQAQIWAIWFTYDDPQVTKIMNQGVKALAEGRYQDAVRFFTRATEQAPGFAEAWNRRATTYYLLGRYKDSLADIEKVLALAPRHFGALSGRGLCLRELGKPYAAIRAYEAALEVNPHMEQVQLEIIRLRHRLHQSA